MQGRQTERASETLPHPWRRTTEPLAPLHPTEAEPGQYDPYPHSPVPEGAIAAGFGAIAERLLASEATTFRIDGYVGVFWQHFTARLCEALAARGVSAACVDVAQAMRPAPDIRQQIAPYIDNGDPVFGQHYPGQLRDFFDTQSLQTLARRESAADLILFFGCGAALLELDAPLLYVELPKNEIQHRSAAAMAANLGAAAPGGPKSQYKRFYFVDWPLLNRHKQSLTEHINWFIDEQYPDTPTLIEASTLRQALARMSETCFRPRPWMAPGAWGGQWLKQRLPQYTAGAENIAWSFELIAPENGLIFSDGRYLLEVAFDWLMHHHAPAVLGQCADWFQNQFPIRFDFLDTFDGGNLSVQCHPSPGYIRQQFGETFTQDETYYILDCKDGAEVYLGFQEGTDPERFTQALRHSHQHTVELNAKQYIQTVPAEKHGLYLIPHGTIHCSGKDNLVLEISATPYIFTFKMYDWMRLDLDAAPRPLHIERGLANVDFQRQGQRVPRELVSQPHVLERSDEHRLVHLPTHAQHFYDVHRLEFDRRLKVETAGSVHILMLVDGSSVQVETASGHAERLAYAETCVVPAAAKRYTLVNEGVDRAFIIKAFMKEPADWPEWMHCQGVEST
jgi:mannose-6-phosphate isomerase class I